MRQLTSLTLALFIVLSGCTAVQKGTHVVKYAKGEAPRTTEVDMQGTYALYAWDDVAPQTTVPLEKGDKIGFERKNDTGLLVAVAGSREPIQIDQSQSYYWKRL